MSDERDPLRVRTTEAMVKTWAKENIAPTPQETIAWIEKHIEMVTKLYRSAEWKLWADDDNVYKAPTFLAAVHQAMRGRG